MMTPEPATPPDNHLPAEFLLRLVRDVWNPLETKMVLAVAAPGGTSKPVPAAELIADPDVLVGMRGDRSNRSPADRAADALDAAVPRGVLIAVGPERAARWYVLATEANRRKAHAGGFTVADVPRRPPLQFERPG